MPTPSLTPNCLCLQLEPGDTRVAATTIAAAPSDATMSVTVANGGPLVRVTQVIVSRIFLRPLTEEEIQELPPFPPSIRENARRNGRVEEREELFRTDGAAPVSVGRGHNVEIDLEFTVPSQTVEGITAARLVVTGSTWTTVEIPVFCVVGRVVATPVVEPERIRCALAPGESIERNIVISSAPTGDGLIACVINGGDVIRLRQIIAFRAVHREFTEEEIQELPPFPPSIRENARREGYIEYQESARSDGTTPLTVSPGQMVQAYVAFTAPASGFANITEASLVIDSPRWQRTEVPLRLTIGQIGVELTTDALTVTQGKSVDFVATVRSFAGPGDVVHFSIDGGDTRLQVVPAEVTLQPRGTAIAEMTLFAAPDAAIGERAAMFEARVFEQLQVHRVPLRLAVLPGGVTVSTRPFTITASQGDIVSFDMTVFSDGGTKHMTFTPGILPEGVRMEPASLTIGPAGGAFVQPMRLTIDRRARTTDRAWTPIAWSANDGVHGGIVNLPLTINLTPDARTFRQEITTPPAPRLAASRS